MWVHWMDAYGTYYPQGWQATMLRMIEVVDKTPNIEYTPTPLLQELLAANHGRSEGPGESIANKFFENDTSGEE